MPDFIPTDEQNDIVDFAQNSAENLAVIARAGAAKTATLELIAEALPEINILCLAFNKKIATEMTERLPDNCEAKTLHGLGYRVWQSFIRGRCKLNDRKCYQLLRAAIEQLGSEDQSEAFENLAETLSLIQDGKNAGWVPAEYKGHWKSLLTDEEFFDALPIIPSLLQEKLIKQVSAASFKAALHGDIDFADMILCPALCPVSWPSPPLTLLDEAQDLSSLNHHVVKKLVKNRRLIAVGDPCQAIYGFRGASENSMREMIKQFNMTEKYLTICFRCSKAVVENARWRAPDMQYPDWAIDGGVFTPATWEMEQIKDGDAIICRNNAPLFSMAIKLIEEGRYPELIGRDIAAPLKKIMKKLGKPNQLKEAALHALEDWKTTELKRTKEGAKGLVHDKVSCLHIIISKTKTLGDAMAYLDHLLARDGRIYLMTGHKSKGLEFKNVFFLDQQLCKIKHGQDANIKYVIETRAKENLSYIQSDNVT